MESEQLSFKKSRFPAMILFMGIGILIGLGIGYLAWHSRELRNNATPLAFEREPQIDWDSELVFTRDFVDKTNNYKGRTLRLVVFPERGSIPEGGSLKDLAGTHVNFYLSSSQNHGVSGVIAMDVPRDIPIPATKNLELVTVRFICAEGSLKSGNQLLSIQSSRKSGP